MRNIIISCLTILLLVLSSCEQDFIQDFDNIVEETNELQARNGSDDPTILLLDSETESSETEPAAVETTTTETEPDATNITLTSETNVAPQAEDEHNHNNELEIDPFIDIKKDPIIVGSLHLACVSNSKFIIRATYDDQTSDLSLEYFDNSANPSMTTPVSIEWSIYNETNPTLAPTQSGATAESADFSFDRDYGIKVSIEFDDNTTFTDEFCLNIGKFNPTAFNVCSDHETTVGCIENSSGPSKKLLVIVDVIL